MADILLITGLSGAGRSQAADVLEDLGWFVVDNMPVELVDKFVELAGASGEGARLALVVGVAAQQQDAVAMLPRLRQDTVPPASSMAPIRCCTSSSLTSPSSGRKPMPSWEAMKFRKVVLFFVRAACS